MTETDEPVDALLRRAKYTPEHLTEEDLARLSALFNQVAVVFGATFMDAIRILSAAMVEFATAVQPYVEYMPGREYRKMRKARQIREHRERVAARVPKWKRPQVQAGTRTSDAQ